VVAWTEVQLHGPSWWPFAAHAGRGPSAKQRQRNSPRGSTLAPLHHDPLKMAGKGVLTEGVVGQRKLGDETKEDGV
jgi:hypothetical protein